MTQQSPQIIKSNIVNQEIEKFKKLILTKPPFQMAYLPLTEQNKLITEAQQGCQVSYLEIVTGFWSFIATQYFIKCGTIPPPKINTDLIEIHFNTMLLKIHNWIQDHNFSRPIGVKICINIKFICLNFRSEHLTSDKNRDRVLVNCNDSATKQYLARSKYAINNQIPFSEFENENFLINHSINPIQTWEKEISQIKMHERLNEQIDYLYSKSIQKTRKKIIKMWIYGIKNNINYTYQFMGDTFGYTRENIRLILNEFKRKMKKESIKKFIFDL
jgi:hypothetical protein